MDLSLPRGIRDIGPEEYEVHQRVRRAFEETASAYNFRSMEPAPLESLNVLRAKSGSQVDDQIYHFRDKAEREIGLRFDLTVGMTRYAVERKGLRPPVKLASYGGVWRYDEPQHARYRWFYQWDVEIFGDQSVQADAEVMDFTHALFRKIGLERVVLQVGDRRIVEEYIRERLGVSSEEKLFEMMRALDKVSKKTGEELLDEYQAKGIERRAIEALLEFGRTRGPPEEVGARLEELKLGSAGDLAALRDSLRVRGIKNVEYNLGVVRGLDYYTGIVFEVADGAHPELGSLCGGGRYDALPRVLGRPELAATGAAGGVERIALSLSKEEAQEDASVYVAYTEASLTGAAAEVLSSLRREGIRSELGQRGKGLSKHLEDANSRGFGWAVIVGKKELESGFLTLRDLRGRKETKVAREDLFSAVRRPL